MISDIDRRFIITTMSCRSVRGAGQGQDSDQMLMN